VRVNADDGLYEFCSDEDATRLKGRYYTWTEKIPFEEIDCVTETADQLAMHA
jgi:hypothetical protein